MALGLAGNPSARGLARLKKFQDDLFQVFFSDSFWLNKPLAKDSILGFFHYFSWWFGFFFGPDNYLEAGGK